MNFTKATFESRDLAKKAFNSGLKMATRNDGRTSAICKCINDVVWGFCNNSLFIVEEKGRETLTQTRSFGIGGTVWEWRK